MVTGTTAKREPSKDGDEFDVLGSRQVHRYLKLAGSSSAIKRRIRRRERQAGKTEGRAE
jgi:hypothetical protein